VLAPVLGRLVLPFPLLSNLGENFFLPYTSKSVSRPCLSQHDLVENLPSAGAKMSDVAKNLCTVWAKASVDSCMWLKAGEGYFPTV